MSYGTLIRTYSIVFTDGRASRQIPLEASSLAHARERAANIARGMMNQHQPGTQDWSAWRIKIEMPDGGQCDDLFPEPSDSQDFAAAEMVRECDAARLITRGA